jgi:uncharacterized protein
MADTPVDGASRFRVLGLWRQATDPQTVGVLRDPASGVVTMAGSSLRDRLVAFADSWPATGFVLLTFVISWAIWIPYAVTGRLADGVEPSLASLVLLVAAWAPALAALALTWLSAGRQGLGALLGQIKRWRVHPIWYAAALLTPLGMVVAARAIERLAGSGWGPVGDPARFALVAMMVVSALLAALGQVIGWVGYALPHLQERFRALPASLMLGAVFAVWHLPMWWGVAGVGIVPAEVVGAVAVFVLFAWMLNASGSLTIAWLFHVALIATDPLRVPGSFVEPAVTLLVAAAVVAGFGAEHLSRSRTRRRWSDLEHPAGLPAGVR